MRRNGRSVGTGRNLLLSEAADHVKPSGERAPGALEETIMLYAWRAERGLDLFTGQPAPPRLVIAGTEHERPDPDDAVERRLMAEEDAIYYGSRDVS